MFNQSNPDAAADSPWFNGMNWGLIPHFETDPYA